MVSLVEILPFDMIHHIVDILASYDYQEDRFQSTNIKTCSLICRTFFHAGCRRHLFRCVEIRDKPYRQGTLVSSAKWFTRFIIENPSMADYVQELCFFPGSAGTYHPPYPLNDPFTQEDLSAIDSLNKLESLTIDLRCGSWGSWCKINQTTRSMLLRLIHLPGIQSLSLSGISRFPALNLPKNSGKFKYLRLDRVSFDFGANTSSDHDSSLASLSSSTTDIDTGSASSFQALRLHGLQIASRPGITFFHELLQTGPRVSSPFIDLTNLRHIIMSFLGDESRYPGSREAIVDIFKRTCLIETAHLTFRYVDSSQVLHWMPMVTRRSIKTLKELSFDVEHPSSSCETPYLGLCDVLEDIHGINCIEVLKICVRLYDVYDQWKARADDEWGLLERIILAPGWSSSLKEIDLHIITGMGWKHAELGPVLSSLPLTQFPGLLSSRRVKFTFRVLPRMPPGPQPAF